MIGSRSASSAFPSFALFSRAHPVPAEMAMVADCGRYFRSLRTRLDASRLQLARRAGCDVSVIAALERGDATGLPPWPETVRIVTALAAPVGLDPRPGLRLIGRIWGHAAPAGFEQPDEAAAAAPRFPNIVRPRPAHPVSGGYWAPYIDRIVVEWTGAIERLRTLRPGLPTSVMTGWTAWRVLLALIVALGVALLVTRPIPIAAMTSAAIAPLAEVVRGVGGLLPGETPSIEGGLRVITVDDPRSRRADRLPTPKRAG